MSEDDTILKAELEMSESEKAIYNKQKVDVSDLIDTLEEIRQGFQQFSSWMITTSLSVLGFLLAMLLQVKFRGSPLPNPGTAVAALTLLTVSAILGFIFRACFVFWKAKILLLKGIKDIARIITTLIDSLAKNREVLSEEVQRNISAFEFLRSKVEESAITSGDKLKYPARLALVVAVGHGATLLSGVLLTIVYICQFIFEF